MVSPSTPQSTQTPVVHVWTGYFSDLARSLESRGDLLSHDELERASRFVFDRDRIKYVLGRTMLRSLLGQYLQCPGQSLVFDYNDQGKPSVANSDKSVAATFNVSHADDLLCIAIADGQTDSLTEMPLLLGVDVEYTNRDIPFHDVALSHFSEPEVSDLKAFVEPRLPFYRCWTRKEAYIKAHGSGVSYGLDQFGVSLDESQVAHPAFDLDPSINPLEWIVYSWTPAVNFLGALVVNRPGVRVEHFTIDRASLAA